MDPLQVDRISNNSLIGQELMYSLFLGCPWKVTIFSHGAGVTYFHTARERGWGMSHTKQPQLSPQTVLGLGGMISFLH